MTYEQDTIGRPVYAGRKGPTLAWDAGSAALPGWLTLASAGNDAGGAITYPVVSGEQLIQMATSTSNSGQCSVSAAALDLTKLAAIRMKVTGLRLSTNRVSSAVDVGIALGCWSATSGGRTSLPTTGSMYQTLGAFEAGGGTQSFTTDYTLRENGEYVKPRDLTYWLYPPTRWHYFAENDDIYAPFQHSTMGLVTAASPILRVLVPSSSTTSQNIKFSRLEIDTYPLA